MVHDPPSDDSQTLSFCKDLAGDMLLIAFYFLTTYIDGDRFTESQQENVMLLLTHSLKRGTRL